MVDPVGTAPTLPTCEAGVLLSTLRARILCLADYLLSSRLRRECMPGPNGVTDGTCARLTGSTDQRITSYATVTIDPLSLKRKFCGTDSFRAEGFSRPFGTGRPRSAAYHGAADWTYTNLILLTREATNYLAHSGKTKNSFLRDIEFYENVYRYLYSSICMSRSESDN